jgi:tRNA (mo5U34)-methyltransferase
MVAEVNIKQSLGDWIKDQVAAEPYWFHTIELWSGFKTPGWSDPKTEKLPRYGLPEDMTGMRVLDIGCSEGFFAFEAERRGAKEVIAVDSSPDSIRKFNICKAALGSKANGFLTSVYNLNPREFGTFDLVMFFGVLYHLRNPILALESVFTVCSGRLLVQSHSFENPAIGEQAMAEFYPFGIESGPPEKRSIDYTVFFVPNAACLRDWLRHCGYVGINHLSSGQIFEAEAPVKSKGEAPDHKKAPWS